MRRVGIISGFFSLLLYVDRKKKVYHIYFITTDIGGSFNIQDLSKPERLLGIRIKCNQDVRTIHLSQPAFINTIAKCFDITIGRPAKSPMDATINYWKTNTDDKPADIPYASIIGSLNYCAIAM